MICFAFFFLQIAQSTQKRWSDVITNVGLEINEFADCADMLQNTMDVDEVFSEAV